jgi:hypothetical protein
MVDSQRGMPQLDLPARLYDTINTIGECIQANRIELGPILRAAWRLA